MNIFDAIDELDYITFEKCLKNVNIHNEDGLTPIMYSIKNLNYLYANFIFKKAKNIDITLTDKNGNDILFMAVCNNLIDFVEQACSYDISSIINKEHNGEYCITRACKNNNFDIIYELIKHGADINLIDKKTKMSCLMYACKHGSRNIIKLLLDQPNINLNYTDNNQWTFIFYVINFCNLRIIRMLTRYNINWNAQNKNGDTIMHLLCTYEKDMEIIFGILQIFDNIVDFNIKNNDGNNCLMTFLSIYKNDDDLTFDWNMYESIVDYLAERVNINQSNNMNDRAITYLTFFDYAVPYTLSMENAQKHFLNNYNQHLLHIACEGVSYEFVNILVEDKWFQKRINLVDKFNNTPLDYICSSKPNKLIDKYKLRGRLDIVKLLIKHGANVNNKNKPLFNAIRYNNTDIAIYLLECGANPYFDKNNLGINALHIANCQNNTKLIKHLVEKYKMNPFEEYDNELDSYGYAMMHNNDKIIKYLENINIV